MNPTTPTELFETARKARKDDPRSYVAVSDGTRLVGLPADDIFEVLGELTGATRIHRYESRFYHRSWGERVCPRRWDRTEARERCGLRVSTDYNRLILTWNTGRLRFWLKPVPASAPVTVLASLAVEPSTLRKAS